MQDKFVKWTDRIILLSILASIWALLFMVGCGESPWIPVTDTSPVAYARLATQAKYDVDLSDTNVMATHDSRLLSISCRTRDPVWGCALSEWTIAIQATDSDEQNCQSALHEYLHLASIRINNDWDYDHVLMDYVDFVSKTCVLWRAP